MHSPLSALILPLRQLTGALSRFVDSMPAQGARGGLDASGRGIKVHLAPVGGTPYGALVLAAAISPKERTDS